jgi:hypothetical protein
MWAERIPLDEQPRTLPVGKAIGGEEVLGHVRVEAGAENPEASLDDERQRRGNERGRCRRQARDGRFSNAHHPAP